MVIVEYDYEVFFVNNYTCLCMQNRLGKIPAKFILMYTKALYTTWKEYYFDRTMSDDRYHKLADWLIRRYNLRIEDGRYL